MRELVVSIRRPVPADAVGLTDVHDAAWREAYRGLLPGLALERMIARRGPGWWHATIKRQRPILVLDLGDRIGGYVSYGPSRTLVLPQRGEIDELYLDPLFQGLGFGTKLFATARRDLASNGLKGLVVWALADNIRACQFYERLGGRRAATAPARFSGVTLEKVAYTFA
ncbi:GNAT family N-acetyltransferase [Chelatococcus sp. GCM10030263]|uniref:GNAT family N-acetyltransferase n=1 Tax=Chelatococcus sp. GCM10030263 TaxID=3273387 RepID=UPI003611D891